MARPDSFFTRHVHARIAIIMMLLLPLVLGKADSLEKEHDLVLRDTATASDVKPHVELKGSDANISGRKLEDPEDSDDSGSDDPISDEDDDTSDSPTSSNDYTDDVWFPFTTSSFEDYFTTSIDEPWDGGDSDELPFGDIEDIEEDDFFEIFPQLDGLVDLDDIDDIFEDDDELFDFLFCIGGPFGESVDSDDIDDCLDQVEEGTISREETSSDSMEDMELDDVNEDDLFDLFPFLDSDDFDFDDLDDIFEDDEEFIDFLLCLDDYGTDDVDEGDIEDCLPKSAENMDMDDLEDDDFFSFFPFLNEDDFDLDNLDEMFRDDDEFIDFLCCLLDYGTDDLSNRDIDYCMPKRRPRPPPYYGYGYGKGKGKGKSKKGKSKKGKKGKRGKGGYGYGGYSGYSGYNGYYGYRALKGES